MQQLGEELKKARQRCFLSQESLAKIIGVSVSTINRWESGESKPNLTAMKQIKDFCLSNDIEYSIIEDLWLNNEVKND